jgi:hypothetical protein
MPSNNEHTPEQEDFSKLIGDLRSMPQAKAPSNFEYLLQQKILESQVKQTPWWKRFFVHGFEIGGFRLPAYAYGGAAAVLIITFGLYLYNASDFDTQLQKMDAETPLEREMKPQSDDTAPIAPEAEDEKKIQAEPQNIPTPGRFRQTPTEPASAAPPPVSTEEFKDNAEAADKQPQLDDEDMMPSTRGVPDNQGERSGDQKIDMEIRQDMNEKRSEARKSIKEEAERESDGAGAGSMMSKGYMMAMPKVKLDSLRLSDSLRKLDSLRLLEKK